MNPPPRDLAKPPDCWRIEVGCWRTTSLYTSWRPRPGRWGCTVLEVTISRTMMTSISWTPRPSLLMAPGWETGWPRPWLTSVMCKVGLHWLPLEQFICFTTGGYTAFPNLGVAAKPRKVSLYFISSQKVLSSHRNINHENI